MNAYLQRALRAPDKVPLILRSLEIKLSYTPAFKAHPHAAARRDINLMALERVEPALRLGFFAWDRFDRRDETTVTYGFDAAGDLSIAIETPGLHSNLLVGLLRQLVVRNHLTAESRRRQDASFQGVANLFTFEHLVQSIEIVRMDGDGDRAADLSSFVVDGRIRLPQGAAPWGAAAVNDLMEVLTVEDGVAARRIDPGVGLGSGLLDRPMASLDMLNAQGWFAPLSELERPRSGDVEAFVREDGDVVVVNDYDGVYYGLVEFLNCVSANRVDRLRIEDI